jgi:hypothetical protein
MDNVVLEKVGDDEVKIIRFGRVVCIKNRNDIEISKDVIRWEDKEGFDDDGKIVLKIRSGFMTLETKDGKIHNLAEDGSIDYTMPE